MKVIAVIHADLAVSPIGTPSRLRDDLAGQPVLRRTAERVLRIEGLDSVHVTAPQEQADGIRRMLAGLEIAVHGTSAPPPAHQQLVRLARKPALDNWRGGIGGACWFDESIHPPVLLALAQQLAAEAVMVVPAHAALLNPALSSEMLKHFRQVGTDTRFVFAQAPPGLLPLFCTTELLAELAQIGYPPGSLLAYRPDNPFPDLTTRPNCYQTPTDVASASGRLLADTAEGLATCRAAVESLADGLDDAATLCRWLKRYRRSRVPDLPAEVEIELTTETATPDNLLRPAGRRLDRRGTMELAMLEKLLAEIAARDDVFVTYGGFGDPLLHPQWPEAIRAARQAGIFGLAVHCSAAALVRTGPEAVMADPPDILLVWLDAGSPQTYWQVTGSDGFERAVEALLAVEAMRRQRNQIAPLVVPGLCKSTANVHELEGFFDFWTERVGSCVIAGYSDRAGQMPQAQVADMAPPRREPCRRLNRSLMVLADGTAVACDQDFKGLCPVGHIERQTVAEIWKGPILSAMRQAHARADYASAGKLCSACREWHRP